MARVRALVAFLLWECIAAEYVRPNRPFFDNLDIPGGQFDERTSLAELKRKFEFLEHTSKPSHVSDDLAADGPVAWYEPEEDELFYDNGECADRFPGCQARVGQCDKFKKWMKTNCRKTCGYCKCADRYSRCQRFVDNYECYEDDHKNWMQRNCRKTCGFCEVTCSDSKYGCCQDRKTPADGPEQAGCGVKLCVDLKECSKIRKDECDNPSLPLVRKNWLRNNCAYTCRFCKASSPKAGCEARKPLYGCCWNGQEATGWNGQGCLPCEDLHPRACQLFECASPFYNVRSFMDQKCPKTCGRCGSCFDKQVSSKCERWEKQGLCNSSAGWKNYMAENCAKTCGFC